MTRFLRRTLALAVGFVVAGLLLEAGYRLLRAFAGDARTGADRRAAYVGQLDWLVRPHGQMALGAVGTAAPDDDDLVPAVRGTVLSPYLGVDRGELLSEYVSMAEYFKTNEAAETFDVLILGGSVAGLLTEHEGANERLIAELDSDPRVRSRPMRVHGQGRGGFKAPQTLVLAELLFQLGWRPDLVVLLDGFNEVALANENRRMGGHPLYPSIRNWSHLTPAFELSADDIEWLVTLRRARDQARERIVLGLRLGVHHSALCTRLLDAWVARPMAAHAEAMRRSHSGMDEAELPIALRGPEPPETFEKGLDGMIDVWAESSISLAASCRARGISFLHVLQPTLFDEGAKPITDQEARVAQISPEWKEGVVAGYPRLRARGRKLAASGVDFMDASRLFASREDSLYYDACHVVAEGSREIAGAIGEAARELKTLGGTER